MAGREEEAKKFLDDMWPDNLTDKELFWSLQKELVEKSKYWELEEWDATADGLPSTGY